MAEEVITSAVGDGPHRCGHINHRVGCVEICAVEEVEKFRAELQVEPLRQRPPFCRRKVELLQSGAYLSIATYIAIGSWQRLDKRQRIEIFVRPAKDHLASELGVPGRTGLRVSPSFEGLWDNCGVKGNPDCSVTMPLICQSTSSCFFP